MKSFIVYESNGRIIRTGSCIDSDFELQAQQGEVILEGEATFGANYIENGTVQPMPKKPEGEYVFDYKTKSWSLDEESTIRAVYSKRDQLLKNGPDRINPMRWSAMSQEDQNAVADYRQALLDITNQSGYPTNIEWPEIPSVFKG